MNNDNYEENYGSIVEPKYGSKRDLGIDEMLTRNILQPHSYSILQVKYILILMHMICIINIIIMVEV